MASRIDGQLLLTFALPVPVHTGRGWGYVWHCHWLRLSATARACDFRIRVECLRFCFRRERRQAWSAVLAWLCILVSSLSKNSYGYVEYRWGATKFFGGQRRIVFYGAGRQTMPRKRQSAGAVTAAATLPTWAGGKVVWILENRRRQFARWLAKRSPAFCVRALSWS